MTGSRSQIDAGRLDIQTIGILDIDLSIARTKEQLRIEGVTSISADPAGYDLPTSVLPSATLYAGTLSMQLGRVTNPPIRMEGGSYVEVPPATFLYITNAAQSGRMLRLYLCPPDYTIKFYLRQDAPFVGPASAFAVSVGTTATLLSASQPGRKSIMIANNDTSAPLYVGPTSAVTTVTGMVIPAGGGVVFDQDTTAWYGIVASGTLDARIVVEG